MKDLDAMFLMTLIAYVAMAVAIAALLVVWIW